VLYNQMPGAHRTRETSESIAVSFDRIGRVGSRATVMGVELGGRSND